MVCIIGGGVIGLASAYALVRAGHDVTVIDARDSLGSETSFANGGQLSYRYVRRWPMPVCRCKPWLAAAR